MSTFLSLFASAPLPLDHHTRHAKHKTQKHKNTKTQNIQKNKPKKNSLAAGGVRGASMTIINVLGGTVQALTQVMARPDGNEMLTQLQTYDPDTKALEAQLNLKRDETCLQLWRRREVMGEQVDGYEYDCWCGSRGLYSAIHCQAYSDVLANATM